ncbi:hypothetical protein OUZ56_004953 [Daphnia magna]|uniref:Uncharacterized protein n=1 Tax=Daphnia magna TaxID=35525 RepID=A0ABQ9YRC4_9CRUS|nr:hypothetical protein OUZ56_004953 [Daphnia magna]
MGRDDDYDDENPTSSTGGPCIIRVEKLGRYVVERERPSIKTYVVKPPSNGFPFGLPLIPQRQLHQFSCEMPVSSAVRV